MKVEIKVPTMGESVTEATISAILKESGSMVQADDEILELETDKVNQILYAPEAGVLELTVAVDDTVVVGQVLGAVDTAASASAAPAPAAAEKPAPTPASKEPAQPAPAAAPQGAGARVTQESYIAELKQDKATPASTPPTPTAAPAPVALPPKAGARTESRSKMTKIRKVIARRLLEAQQGAAMLTTFNEVDMSAVMNLRKKYQEQFTKRHDMKLGFMSFFVQAAVSALKAWPQLNSFIDGEEMVQRNYYDIGIAVGTPRGLIVPVLRDCDQMGFADVEKSIVGYAQKAREGKLSMDDLHGGSFTITNGGIYGSLISTPILNPPQSGILGMHSIQKRAVVVNDEIVIRPMMYLAMSYDHRVVDGREAVSFLVHIKNCLEEPERLLLDVF